ncbi:MAG: hypothetical protein JZD41_00200 [Thermoproteus sp.]|nr:hypothetical protein [Thermoproteus sp.]
MSRTEISCEVHEFVNHGTIRWRRYYRRSDCYNKNDIMLGKGVEDLLPPNKGYFVRPLLKKFSIPIERPRTTGELEELRHALREAGVPPCSKYSTTQSVLDWVWYGYIPIDDQAEP